MREMRPAAGAPLGWVDFTTRKCQRGAGNVTRHPGKNSESDSKQLFRQISPQIFAQNAPKFASTLFQFSPDISLLPYIKI